MKTANERRSVKWFILFIGADLLLGAVCAIIYTFAFDDPKTADAKQRAERAAFEAELTKAQKEAMQHTGR